MDEVKDDRRHADLTGREALLQALRSFSRGDFSVRLSFKDDGIDPEIATAFNAAMEAHERLSRQAGRLAEQMRQFERPGGEAESAARRAWPARRKPGILAGQARALRLSMNSMLTLAKLLADNEDNNLSAKQIDYAQTIYSAGIELLGIVDQLATEAELEPVGPRSLASQDGYDMVQTLIGRQPVLTRRDAAGRQPYRGRRSRRPDDGIVLIAHHDIALAAKLLERVRANGYQGKLATDLATLRMLLREHRPDAVLVGTALSDGDGWMALDLLKSEPETRRLPVSMISSREGRHVCLELANGTQALETQALDVLHKAMAGDEAAVAEAEALGRDSIVFRPGGDMEETLLQATRFLHETVGTPLSRRRMQSRRRRTPLDLVGKKVLVVNGDIREIYAMTGALEQQGMLVMYAERGAQGAAVLERNPDTDVVLIDAVQSDADGCGAIRLMRTQFASLPIIALTRQAGDTNREECIAAGASDCLAKPVDDEQLVALLRVWLLTPH